jgi:hypothetical protein
MPGADIYLLDGAGFTRKPWKEMPFVQHWRTFLWDPALYLDPLLEDD